jgi:hypothetical protein
VEFAIAIAVVLFVAYKLVVRANKRETDAGRNYLNLPHVDASTFLSRPASSVRTPEEVAAFNYLAMRPWRDTPNHFHRYLKMFRERDQLGDREAREFVDLTLADVGCTEQFVALCMLAPLPERLADVASRHFAEWTESHKRELEAVPNMSVGYFMNMSTRAAANALFDTGPMRVR